MTVIYVSSFSNDTKQMCRKIRVLKSAYVSFMSRCWRGNPSEFHGNVRRLSRRENRLSSLGIPFRFLKYTASEYRKRNVSIISITYAHNTDCPFVLSFPFSKKARRKKEKYSHAASGAPAV